MKITLPVITISQFFCTSLWFAGNSIIADIAGALQLDASFLAHLTSVIQFGFISGTLVFAILTIADRFSPSKVFFCCSILAAVCNLGMGIDGIQATEILVLRFLTGFFLAGIYPVGIKIAADHYQADLGKSLGFLVAALAFGTAFPHLANNFTKDFPWEYVIYSTSALSILGGCLMLLFVGNGPYRKKGQKLTLTAFTNGFKNKRFRSAAFGYFGHMWELYTFWAFVPVILSTYKGSYPESNLNVSLLSFTIIASGGLACIISGLLSTYFAARKLASTSLLLSCLCCIVSPIFLFSNSQALLIAFLVFWGIVVIADSPLLSTLVAQNAPVESKGASITIVNCIGFSITIVSIQFINALSTRIDTRYIYILLAIGPIVGLFYLLKKNPLQ